MSRKVNTTSKRKSTTSSGVIVSKALKNIKEDSAKQGRTTLNGVDRHEMIALAAYYRAERRNFINGDRVQDWLEAEAEIDSSL